ncbi:MULTISPECIES: P-loop NTPase fold protein [Pseudoalteromonas]|uniref:P-loop NTPase fold protein n=1 Tax=Pseudoalteromonas TaxID=53246 RepID=UPI000C33660A|nr:MULTISPECIES: P-loop NTPase fold protein [Pseudoalteromonas]PKG64323.1 NTPase [Pseudoalteromonas arctica]PKG69154.1 NTPase [Pseudoalteromonas sp. GutCa3]
MKQADQIIELLQDTSFPQVVLLDGAWGSGKTHFIKHYLRAKIEELFGQKVYFFSLYGISSIDDFRDKIISLSLTDKEEASVFAKYFSKAIDGAAQNLGERGIGAVLSGAAGAYKYKLYGELDDCILILDDLERVADEKLIKNILGESLSLAESKNIKVVVVANEDKLNCKNDIEKVFADKYKFSFTHEEVVSILKVEYENLDDQLANELLLNITAINSKNIRVLKRALSKFTRIQREVSEIKNVVLDQALSRILSDIVRICCAKFEHSFSKEKIIDAIDSRIIRQIKKSNDEAEIEGYKKLDAIFEGAINGSNQKLLSYCCDGLYEFSNLEVELNLPMRQTLLDAMQSIWVQNQLSESDFKQGVQLLEEYIFSKNDIDIYKWFSTCDIYIYMQTNKVIESTTYTKATLLRLCDDIDVNQFKITAVEDDFDQRRRISFYNEEVDKRFNLKKAELETLKASNKNSEFSQKFQASWASVKNEAHQNLMHTPFFQNLNVNIVKAALQTWSNEEVFQFVRFINERYRFSNIDDFFQPELEALKTISSMVGSLLKEIGFGLKVASLSELHEKLLEAHSKMELNISKKEQIAGQ